MNEHPINFEIKILLLNGKKLTKSIFNQIELVTCFNENMEFIGDEILGYVKDKNDKYVLWKVDGKLRKMLLTPYLKLKKIDNYPSFDNSEWFLKKVKIEYEAYDGDKLSFKDRFENHKRYDELIENVHEHLIALNEQQIFI